MPTLASTLNVFYANCSIIFRRYSISHTKVSVKLFSPFLVRTVIVAKRICSERKMQTNREMGQISANSAALCACKIMLILIIVVEHSRRLPCVNMIIKL